MPGLADLSPEHSRRKGGRMHRGEACVSPRARSCSGGVRCPHGVPAPWCLWVQSAWWGRLTRSYTMILASLWGLTTSTHQASAPMREHGSGLCEPKGQWDCSGVRGRVRPSDFKSSHISCHCNQPRSSQTPGAELARPRTSTGSQGGSKRGRMVNFGCQHVGDVGCALPARATPVSFGSLP